MNKISELDTEEVHSLNDVRDKLNEVIRAIDRLKCVEEERPVLEGLCEGECFLISMSEDGLLCACNTGGGVHLKRVKEGQDANPSDSGKKASPEHGVEVW
jgi:hypothetical protein